MTGEEVSGEILNIAKAYAELLRDVFDNIEAVYVFGSQVSRTRSDSDIDIAVISKEFSDDIKGITLKLKRLRRQIDGRIEPHPFYIEDFTEDNPFAKSIMETGIKII